MNKKKYIITMPEYWIFSLLWLIVTLSKPVQFVLFIIIASILLYKDKFKLKYNNISILMILLFVIHVCAILHNLAVINGPSNRIIPAFNNAITWLVTAIFYSLYKENKNINIDYIGKCCCFNLGILFIEALATIYLYYIKQIPSYYIFGKTLYETTYLQEVAATKFIGLNDFSNMNLFYIMLMMCLSMQYIQKRKKYFQALMFIISAVEVFLIHSRSGMILFTASIMFAYIELVSKRYKKLLWCFICICGILLFILGFNSIKTFLINKIIYGNKSSTSFRALLLSTSIKEALNTSPIIGMGLKRYLYVGYPLGSHSSYVGFFYKTGIVGLLTGMTIFFSANWKLLKMLVNNQNIKTIFIFLLSFVVLFAIEDVDGTNWSSILYFSSLAIISNTRTTGEKYENKSVSNISATIS